MIYKAINYFVSDDEVRNKLTRQLQDDGQLLVRAMKNTTTLKHPLRIVPF